MGRAFGVERWRVSKVFSRETLGTFEDASASIPLRQIDRAFESAGIRLGNDPGGSAGNRRIQFRRYVASVDQLDPRQLERLGNALGALIGEVAASKIEFLVKGAEGDGFAFADRAFRPAATAPDSFAVTNVEDLASIDERVRRLRVLADGNPAGAVSGARQLCESVCRTVLRQIGTSAPAKKTSLVDLAKATLRALEASSPESGAQNLTGVVAGVDESSGPSSRHARLAVGAAATFAGFVVETYRCRPVQTNT